MRKPAAITDVSRAWGNYGIARIMNLIQRAADLLRLGGLALLLRSLSCLAMKIREYPRITRPNVRT